MPVRHFLCLVVGLWFALTGLAFAQELQPVPPLSAHVTDTVGLLPDAQRAAVEEKLVSLEQQHGAQVAVLIVASTHPEAIEAYGLRVAEAWKLGRKGVDDGLLFLIARDDRRMRIEVGSGLEGAIPDAIAKRIIAEVVTPHFKAGDFAGGVEAGVERDLRAHCRRALAHAVTGCGAGQQEWELWRHLAGGDRRIAFHRQHVAFSVGPFPRLLGGRRRRCAGRVACEQRAVACRGERRGGVCDAVRGR